MINNVVKNKLCSACGTCAAACKYDNIKFVVDRHGNPWPHSFDNCVKCGACVNSCPGISVDFDKLNTEIFGKKKIKNAYLGNFEDCFIGYSKNPQTRLHSASGGVVTSFCMYLLEHKLVDGIITVKKSKNPLKPDIAIIDNKKDLIECSGSRYVAVPLNKIISKIENSNKKYALVALPCQIHGIRKYEKVNPKISYLIPYKIGLFCSHMTKLQGIKYLAKKSGVKNIKKAHAIKFKEGDLPGNIVFETEFKKYEFPSKNPFYYYFTYPHSIARCRTCTDLSNELADISVGSGYSTAKNKKLSDANEKYASIIVRNKSISETLKESVHTIKISPDELIRAQKTTLGLKKAGFLVKKRYYSYIPHYTNERTYPIPTNKIQKIVLKLEILIFLQKIGVYRFLPVWFLRRFYLKKEDS